MREFFITLAFLAFANMAIFAAINVVTLMPAAACELDTCNW